MGDNLLALSVFFLFYYVYEMFNNGIYIQKAQSSKPRALAMKSG